MCVLWYGYFTPLSFVSVCKWVGHRSPAGKQRVLILAWLNSGCSGTSLLKDIILCFCWQMTKLSPHILDMLIVKSFKYRRKKNPSFSLTLWTTNFKYYLVATVFLNNWGSSEEVAFAMWSSSGRRNVPFSLIMLYSVSDNTKGMAGKLWWGLLHQLKELMNC